MKQNGFFFLPLLAKVQQSKTGLFNFSRKTATLSNDR